MRTLVCFILTPLEEKTDVSFFVVEGDYHHLDGVFINSGAGEELESELLRLTYDDTYSFKYEGSPSVPHPDWDWDVAITCGFMK